jgi:hypothetical protein
MDSEIIDIIKKIPWNFVILSINLVILFLILLVIDNRLVDINYTIEDSKSELHDLNDSIRRIDENLDAFEKLHKPKEIIKLSKETNF